MEKVVLCDNCTCFYPGSDTDDPDCNLGYTVEEYTAKLFGEILPNQHYRSIDCKLIKIITEGKEIIPDYEG